MNEFCELKNQIFIGFLMLIIHQIKMSLIYNHCFCHKHQNIFQFLRYMNHTHRKQ